MGESIWRDRKGNLIDLHRWAELFRDPSYRILRTDDVGNAQVTTVWFGEFPYSEDGLGPMFHTVIVREVRPGETEWWVEKWYETEADAVAGHARRVADLTEAQS